jgi:hypothetical protein
MMVPKRAGLYLSILVGANVGGGHQSYHREFEITKELGEHLEKCSICRNSFVEKIEEIRVIVNQMGSKS